MNKTEIEFLTHELNYSKNCVACESHKAVLENRIKELIESGDNLKILVSLKECFDTEFHGINCMDNGEEYGFEGCYNDKLNHPDPRPAHQIWLKKVHAEKLFELFEEEILYPEGCPKCNSPVGWSKGYCSMCEFRQEDNSNG